jgi:hypothetical protein
MKHFGQFLQDHLDRHPLPDRQTYLEWRAIQKADGKPNPARERLVRQLKRQQKLEQQRAEEWKAATPRQRAMIRTLEKLMKEERKAAK